LAREHGVRSIALPAVGTGIAGFPMDECARVMATCLHQALVSGWAPDEVRFVLFGADSKTAFEAGFMPLFESF
jgi:O-acetyl-ADP-ribose deacetylase